MGWLKTLLICMGLFVVWALIIGILNGVLEDRKRHKEEKKDKK